MGRAASVVVAGGGAAAAAAGVAGAGVASDALACGAERLQAMAPKLTSTARTTDRIMMGCLISAQPLHVGCKVADVLGRQTLGNRRHDVAIGTCGVLVAGTRVARALRVIIELFNCVGRLLRAQRRITCGKIAATDGSVAGDAAGK